MMRFADGVLRVSLTDAVIAMLGAADRASAQTAPAPVPAITDQQEISNTVAGRAVPQTTTVQFVPNDPVQIIIANGRRLGGRQSVADCMAEAERSGDIIVCGSINNGQEMPLPEVFGPVAGSSDGAAVNPHGPPCGASISNQCWRGVDVIATAIGAVRLVGYLLNPNQNLGEGTRIPERFRGANR